jgi:hypothetical protein
VATFTSGGTNGYSSGGPPGYPATGSITGGSTAFGTVELIYDEGGPDYLVIAISSPVGTPTTIYIASTGYALTFDGTFSGYDFYITTGKQAFSNGVSYYWGFVPDSTYVVSLDGGSFALTGGASTFLRSRVFAQDGGSFALTGGSASFNKGFALAMAGGAFTLSGGDLSFTFQRKLALAGGLFSLSGGAVTFNKGRLLVLGGGDFLLSGGTLQFNLRRIVVDGGSYALAGGPSNFDIPWRLTPDAIPGDWNTANDNTPAPWALVRD